jgi:hypothetical protein
MKKELVKLALQNTVSSIVDFATGGIFSMAKGVFSTVGGLFGFSSGGSAYNMGNGNVLQGASRGTEFVVPSGFPNDSYLQPVESGERVSVSSAADTRTMLGLYNKMVNLLSAINTNIVSGGGQAIVIKAEGSLARLIQDIDYEKNDMVKRGYDGYGTSSAR